VMRRRLALAACGLVVALACTLLLECAAGALVRPQRGLVFPAHSRFHARTAEFVYEVRVNELGFRGPAARGSIVALGDSFTYGWGVAEDETWPARLAVLHGRGLANLGKPGAGPADYADLAERALPVLRPSRVVVAVTQNDDLHQSTLTSRRRRLPPAWKRIATRLYPNLFRLRTALSESAEAPTVISETDVQRAWSRQAARFVARRRAGSLDPKAVAMLTAGEVNPHLGLYYDDPEKLFLSERPPADAIDEMAFNLRRIAEAAGSIGASVLVVSVPWPAYVSRAHLENLRLFGARTDESLLETTAPDRATARAAERARLPFVEVTAELRRRQREQELYFPIDGHPNAAGQRAFAEALAPRLR
jgi:lysophospholipase L1-like esterase